MTKTSSIENCIFKIALRFSRDQRVSNSINPIVGILLSGADGFSGSIKIYLNFVSFLDTDEGNSEGNRRISQMGDYNRLQEVLCFLA